MPSRIDVYPWEASWSCRTPQLQSIHSFASYDGDLFAEFELVPDGKLTDLAFVVELVNNLFGLLLDVGKEIVGHIHIEVEVDNHCDSEFEDCDLITRPSL